MKPQKTIPLKLLFNTTLPLLTTKLFSKPSSKQKITLPDQTEELRLKFPDLMQNSLSFTRRLDFEKTVFPDLI